MQEVVPFGNSKPLSSMSQSAYSMTDYTKTPTEVSAKDSYYQNELRTKTEEITKLTIQLAEYSDYPLLAKTCTKQAIKITKLEEELEEGKKKLAEAKR